MTSYACFGAMIDEAGAEERPLLRAYLAETSIRILAPVGVERAGPVLIFVYIAVIYAND
jgi:hypothetical protein